MGATLNYNRDKDPDQNDTPMDLTILVGEKPDAPTAIGGTGTTAVLDYRLQCDADESVGVDVQDLFKLEATPTISSDGIIRLAVTVTPILGDASEGTPVATTVEHDENMDAWQATAGRPQQP